MAFTLKPVDEKNFEACLALSVKDDQKQCVASNMYSLAECYVYEAAKAYVMVEDETLVGFIMISYEDDTSHKGPWLVRFMVDKNHQGKGYGRKAMTLTLKLFERFYPHEAIYLSTEPSNKHAIKLYESFGFKATGEIVYDEAVFKRNP